MQCEYGTNPNPSCDILYTCDSTGWSSPGPMSCVVGTCPADYASVPQGKSCTPFGLDCAYPQGQCNCADTVPVSMPGPVWQCSTPMTGCPSPRPDVGTSCTSEGLDCDYGACTGGINEVCKDGIWQEQPTACPV
jgi:hypothetical protein